MSQVNALSLFYLAHLSFPLKNRVLYQAARKHGVHRVLEIGLEDGARLKRLLGVMGAHAAPEEVVYTAVDLFESRPAAQGQGLSLKEVHRTLTSAGVRSRLVPGDPLTALARSANSIGAVDLIIVSGGHDPATLAQAWTYVPRMMHDRTLAYREVGSGAFARMELLTRDQIAALAASAATLRRAA